MNEMTFLTELETKLSIIDPPMRKAIIDQYAVLLKKGYDDGKDFEQLYKEMGTTDFIANYYINELITKNSNANQTKTSTDDTSSQTPKRPLGVAIVRGLLVGFALFLFNTIIVLAPYLTAWSLLIAFMGVGIVLVVTAVMMLLTIVISIPISGLSIPVLLASHPLLLVGFALFLASLGVIFILLVLISSKYMGIWTYKYSLWNIKTIRGDDNV